ncbi:MAG: hypothetical protein GXY77_16015 [Fibrobacter sp.]|nr:hypothetical protein [Fibrobacter sp.]
MHIFLNVIIAVLFFSSCIQIDTVEPKRTETPPLPFKTAENSDLVINEVSIKNSGSTIDEFNNDPDWIEIYNKGKKKIDLSGFFLSDDQSDLQKWGFRDVEIDPDQYILVYASGLNHSEIPAKPQDDTVKILVSNMWTDSMDLPGHSTIVPYEYEKLTTLDSTQNRVLSATINLVDNRPDLDWSSAMLSVVFKRQHKAGTDYSMYNTLKLKMTLEKNKKLVIRLVQKSFPEWKGFYQTITGTGIKDDEYQIQLVQGTKGLDLTQLTGLRIEAKEYNFGSVSFTLSGMVFTHSGYNLHTNFKLSGNESGLFLTNQDTVVYDFVKLSVVPHYFTQGIIDKEWKVLVDPTPGAKNKEEYYNGIADIPQIVKRGGFYSKPVSVELFSSAKNQQIHYTLDGSIPNRKSPVYSKPIKIDSTSVLRYASFGDGLAGSNIQTETFFINEKVTLPIVSLSTNPSLLFDADSGIYMDGPNASDEYPYFGANFWQEKEIIAHIEFFDKDKKKKFGIDGGLSIAGNWSKAERKKSLAVDFREKYGSSELDYPVFPFAPEVTKFKKLVLRNNGGNSQKAFIEDPFMQSLIDDRNIDYQKYRPVIVFINGKYYGLHQLMEPANHDYVYSNHGLTKEEIDFFDISGMMKCGTPDNWLTLNSYFKKSGTNAERELSDSIFTLIKNEMEIYNFIDYMAFQIFINNTDWPANNCRYWRERNEKGRWRWLVFDTDYGFGNWGFSEEARRIDYNTLEFALDDSKGDDDYPNGKDYTYPLRALLQNHSFKEDFINRFATLLATNFSPDRILSRIDQFANEIEPEIKRDYEFWYPDERSYDDWKQDVRKLKEFGQERGQYIYDFIGKRFGCKTTCSVNIASNSGIVCINDMPIKSSSFKGTYFTSIPLRVKAIPEAGRQFVMWSDKNTENPRIFSLEGDISISPIFK